MSATNVKGGKGCFAAGSKVYTPLGQRNIEELKVGDQVFSYTDTGEVEVDTISAVHHHEPEEVHSFAFWGADNEFYFLNATPSHWVQNQYGSFVPVGTLTEDDCAVDVLGHLRPLIESQELSVEPVFNLTVEKNRTFIVNGLRVHNQGTGARHPKVKGKKGDSKGAGGRAAVEDPNTLRSRATIKTLELVSQGEVFGLKDTVNPLKSVYFDDTPLMNADGSLNFGNCYAEQRVGTAAQTYIQGFPSGNNPVQVGTSVTASTPVTRTVGSDVDAARVTIGVQALYSQDRNSGDTKGHTVNFYIQAKLTSSATWTTVAIKTITGKTMRPYERDYRIPRPTGTGTWDIRVVRSSPDDADSSFSSVITFSRYTELKDVKLAYPNWAVIGVAADAESTGGSIPKVSFHLKGILCKVPSNYNPATRTYSGTWNGLFSSTLQWTDNPAWVLYDLLTNVRYGMGEFVSESMIDRYSFYNAAVYNDASVSYTNSSGTTSSGPRFTFNGPIQTREDAWKLIQSVASCCNSFIGEAGGYITLIQDRPKTVKKTVTRSNVINGKFSYTSSNLLARHTAVNVTFNDPTDNYLPRTITEKLTAAVTRYGYNPTDLVAYGCTNEAQARRNAKWLLETENTATHVITYQASWDHVDTVPGDIVKVYDPAFSGYDCAGRIVSATTGSATLDRVVDHTTPGTYTIDLALPDGTIVQRAITGWGVSGGKSTITFASVGSIAPAVESVYGITGPIEPRQFRILSQKEDKPGIFTITGILHDPTKYARIEQGIVIPAAQYSGIGKTVPKAATNLQVREESYFDNTTTRRRLRLNWANDAADFVVAYTIKYSINDTAMTTVSGVTQREFLLDDITPGKYRFVVTCHNIVNMASPSAETTYVVNTGENGTTTQPSTLQPPTNIGVELGTSGTRQLRFWNGDVLIGWDDNIQNTTSSTVTDVTQAYYIEVLRPDDTVMHTATVYRPEKSYLFTLGTNSMKFSTSGYPTGVFKVRIACIDAFGRTGTKSAAWTFLPLSFTQPDVISLEGWEKGDLSVVWTSLTSGNASMSTAQTDTLDIFSHYVVNIKDASTGILRKQVTTTSRNYTFTLADNLRDPSPLTSAIIEVKAQDIFGLTSPTGSATFNATLPGTVTSLSLQTGGTTFTTRDVPVTWSCPVSLSDARAYATLPIFDYFEVTVTLAAGGTKVYKTKDVSFTYTFEQNAADNGGQAYKSPAFTIAAVDVFGRRGASLTQTFTAVTPPSATNLQMVNNGGTTFMTQDLAMSWECTNGAVVYSSLPIFDAYEVVVYAQNGTTVKRTLTTATEVYTYLFTDNTADFGGAPSRSFVVRVRARDVFGQFGSSVTSTFNNPAPAAPGIAFTAGYNIQHFTLQAPNDPDISGYQVYISKTAGFTAPTQGTLVYDGNALFGNFPVDPNTTYYARAACYDVYNKTSLSWSPIISFSTLQDVKSTEYKVYGVTLTPNAATNTVSWTSGTLAKVGETNTVTIGSGTSGVWSAGVNGGGPMFIYAVWPNTTLSFGYDLASIYSSNPGGTVTILGVYRGGTDLTQGDGRVIMDGGYLLAQSVGANQVAANAIQAVHVGANLIIAQAANINDAVITNAKLVDLTVDTIKLKNGSITNITGVNSSIANLGFSSYTPATQRDVQGNVLNGARWDTGWQTVATQVVANPGASAGTALSGSAFVSFGVSMANGLTTNGGGTKPFWQEGTSNMGGSHSYRVVFEAQDMNDGQWYVQGVNNTYWPHSSASGCRVRQFTGDDPSLFNGMLSFNCIQSSLYGSATTASQGTFYRPGQNFRFKLQVRTSVYTNVYTLENFVSYVQDVSGNWWPSLNGVAPYTNIQRYRYWLVNGSSGIVSSTSSSLNAFAYGDDIGNTRINNGYIVVQQVFK